MRRICIIIILMCLVVLGACGKEERPAGTFNPMGMSGKHNEEAERAFAKAHVLWRDEHCTDPDEAIRLLTKAVELEPDYAQAWLYRGLAYTDKQWFSLAVDDLDKSIRLNPVARAYAYRGLAHMRMGNYFGARRDLDTAIELDPDEYRAWNFRAAVNFLDKRPSAACDDWEEGCDRGDCTGLENARKEGICE